MTVAVRFIRRFRVKGRDEERVRVMDLAAPPPAGAAIDLGEDGTPPVAVASTVLHAREIEFRVGFKPSWGATVRLLPEPAERLAPAEAGGWLPKETI